MIAVGGDRKRCMVLSTIVPFSRCSTESDQYFGGNPGRSLSGYGIETCGYRVGSA